METLHIEHFQARYHLPPSMFDQLDRLDHILGEMLDGSLALALERLGISPREEICIRRVHAPVRLRSNSVDSDLITDWSMSLAESFHEVLSQNDPANVIRYPSRIHGFIDFADSVARGDFHRAWAWKQLNFSVDPRIDSVSEAAEKLVSSLVRESQYIIPLLTAMAAAGRLRRLLLLLPPIWWQDLAVAALMAHGVEVDSSITETIGGTPVKAPTAARVVAERIIRESSLASVVFQDQTVFLNKAQLLPSWAKLILLEREPVLFRGGLYEAEVILGAIEEKIHPKTRLSKTVPAEKSAKMKDYGTRETTSTSQEIPNQARSSQKLPHSHGMGASLREDDIPAWEPIQREAFLRPRSQGCTEFGGLLFLLPLLEHSGIIDEIVVKGMGSRSLGWFLHGLALHLLPTDTADPATLAFCGLRPDAPLPWENEPGPNEDEKQLLANWRLKIIKALAEHITWQKMKPEQILQKICCRKAAIVADPGWFEVIFSLQDVSTEIRRAGLDQDPGFIPWLGVIIKFFYE
ncbi:hypothetical protein [Desulfogranum marinum]|uniref:hypothetical protein n=1 Tax=Desulfogranum marinum TaxID=453220 RepID=UPI0029C98481|nr:hypothetical protein [Desulfogranum marinum]